MNGFADASISRIVERLILHLGQVNYSWHVGGMCGLGGMQPEFTKLGVKVVDFSANTRWPWEQYQRIRDYVSKHNICLIHTHTPRTILAVALALGIASPVHHLATKHILFRRDDRRWGSAFLLLDCLSLYLPEVLVAVSETMHRQIASLPGLKRKRILTIRNAIDFEKYQAPEERNGCREEFGLAPDQVVIGYAGRIAQAKKIDLLVRAYSNILAVHPEARLIIVGEGEQKPSLEMLAKRLGISQAVIWAGFRTDIPRLLAAMDIFVQPSSNEGLSLSLLEAMAAGKPVIATNVGGTAEVVSNGQAGLLIPPHSLPALQSAMLQLLDNPQLRSRLAEEAGAIVYQEFQVARMMENYRHLYEELCLGAVQPRPQN